MKTVTLAAAIAVLLATSAAADGPGPRRVWKGPAYRYAVSYNVITPYYVGYYPSHYSYYRPDPIPSGHHYKPRLFQDGCWFAYDGVIWWGC
jgi:hypothetical protein